MKWGTLWKNSDKRRVSKNFCALTSEVVPLMASDKVLILQLKNVNCKIKRLYCYPIIKPL